MMKNKESRLSRTHKQKQREKRMQRSKHKEKEKFIKALIQIKECHWHENMVIIITSKLLLSTMEHQR